MHRTQDHNQQQMMDETSRNTFIWVSWVNVLGNVLKVVVEGAIGMLFGSMALIADAAHSVADLLGSLVVLIWGRLFYEKPDLNHPHGHERIEPITALFVGMILILIGCKIGYDSGKILWHGTHVTFSYFLVFGLGFAAVDMILVYLYTVKANKDVQSPSLHALARDCLNDFISSMAAMIGVIGIAYNMSVLDPIAGGMVSVLMLYEGGKIGYENVNYLTGAAPPEEKREEIQNVIYDHPETRGMHDFAAYYIGPVIEVEMHVEVDGDLTVREAHDIETEIRSRVLDVEDVYDVHVHLDPAGMGEWREAEDQEDTTR